MAGSAKSYGILKALYVQSISPVAVAALCSTVQRLLSLLLYSCCRVTQELLLLPPEARATARQIPSALSG
jgi:hypothetical protein